MKAKNPGLVHRMTRSVRGRLISGLLILVPLGITLFVLSFIFNITVGVLVPVLHAILPDLPPGAASALSLLLLLSVLYLAGSLASLVLGRKLIAFGERIVDQIPVVKSIYSSSKQVIQLFMHRPEAGMRRVVLISFPSPDLKAFGFVTGEITLPDGTPCYKVFIPTTPNPTTGFLQLSPVASTPVLDLTPEEAIQLIMSGGLLAPAALQVRPAGEI